MALIETYRSNLLHKKNELSKLYQDKAKESSKIAPLQKKISAAKKSASTTKSSSTLKSKLSEINRTEKSLADINTKLARIEKKIAQKSNEVDIAEKKYHSEEIKLDKKEALAEKRRLHEDEVHFQDIDNTLKRHEMSILDLQSLPEKISVLFLAANPSSTPQLRLDEEARAINETIRKSAHRDSLEFQTRWALRASDLFQAINEVNPTIIHFSGHGTDTGELVFQNPDGTAKFISQEAIVQAISTVSDKVKLVFFNACFSAIQAKSVVEHIDAAIGMNLSIGDTAACVFASQFYSSIGFGHSLSIAFAQARAALLLEGIKEEDTPELFIKDGLNANEIFIVRPNVKEEVSI
jgi:hypothetical protein